MRRRLFRNYPIQFRPLLHLDAADTDTIIDSGGSVSDWNDKTSNGYDFDQASGSKQPTTDSATVNNKNVIVFNGTSDQLDGPAIGVTGQFSIFVCVYNSAVSTNTQYVISQDVGGYADDYLLGYTPEGSGISTSNRFAAIVQHSSDSSRSIVEDDVPATTDQAVVLTHTYNSVTYILYKNGVNKDSASKSSQPLTDRVWAIGAHPTANTRYWNGAVAEIIVFDTAFDAYKRKYVENYLISKWDVFSPTQISGCQLWLDAADTATITESSNLVSDWADKSGNSRNMTQATGSEQPLTNTDTMNGLNTLTFATGDYFDDDSWNYAWDSDWTIFAVAADTETGDVDFKGIVGNRFGAGAARWFTFGTSDSTDDIIVENNDGSIEKVFSGYNPQGTGGQVYAMKHEGTDLAGFRNGVEFGTSITATDVGDISNDFKVGIWLTTTQTWEGNISEIIVYDSALGRDDFMKVSNYLMKKWGVS